MRIRVILFGLALAFVATSADAQRQQVYNQPRVQQRYVPQQRVAPPRYSVRPQRYIQRPHYQRRAYPQRQSPQRRSYGGGRAPQIAPHYQQHTVYPARPRVANARVESYKAFRSQAYNHVMHRWEPRRMHRIALAGLGIAAVATYGYISYSSSDYDGPPWIELPGIGPVSFEGDDRYPGIIDDLMSGDPSRVAAAIALIEGSAIAQGIMEMGESDGD